MEKLYLILEIIKEYRKGTLLTDITVLLILMVILGVLRLVFGDKKILQAIKVMIYICLIIMGILLIHIGLVNSKNEYYGNLYISLSLLGLMLILGVILYILASKWIAKIKDKRNTRKRTDKKDK